MYLLARVIKSMGIKMVLSGERRVISAADSKVKVMLIPTNEELAIARETLRLTK